LYSVFCFSSLCAFVVPLTRRRHNFPQHSIEIVLDFCFSADSAQVTYPSLDLLARNNSSQTPCCW
jgi:hypothetical protein